MSQDGTGAWDDDQTEAVIDHLDVIGAKLCLCCGAYGEINVNGPLVDPQVATMSNLTNAANSIVMYVVALPLGVLN